MSQQLTVIRGAPGSGKSTLAKVLRDAVIDETFIVESDYYRSMTGVYVYDPDPVVNARITQLVYDEVRSMIRLGSSVIVADTFLRNRSVEPYRALARSIIGCSYNEIICRGEFGSIHGVPPEQAAAMRRQLEL